MGAEWRSHGDARLEAGERFLPYRWEGYDEALVLYVLGLGSPTHPLPAASYQAWASTYEWRTIYDTPYLHAGSLFTHQLSHLWLDLRGIQDAFMRGCPYIAAGLRAAGFNGGWLEVRA